MKEKFKPITIKQLIKKAEPHEHVDGGYQYEEKIGNYILSVVGGPRLYGDFQKNFEVAVIDERDGWFVTKDFYDIGGDDVIGYADIDLINYIRYMMQKA